MKRKYGKNSLRRKRTGTGDDPLKTLGSKTCIRIQENEKISASGVETLLAGPGLPNPVDRWRRSTDDPSATCDGHRRRRIPGAIVYDDHFCSVRDRRQEACEVMFFVARRDDDADCLSLCATCITRHGGKTADQQEPCRQTGDDDVLRRDHVRSRASESIIMRATCWPESATIGMPPPGFTLPPTK